MYQRNPLLESFNDILRKSKSLTPENRKRYLRHYMMTRFDGSNLKTTRDNYGKRLLVGSGKKIRNIASKNNRKVALTRVNDPLESRTIVNGVFSHPSQKALLNNLERKYIDKGRDIVRLPRINSSYKSKINPLFNANQAAHESDEYANLVRRAKRNNTTIDKEAFDDMRNVVGLPKIYSHYRGNVLDKEKERHELQDLIFGKRNVLKIRRSPQEIKQSRLNVNKSAEELKSRISKNPKLQRKIDVLNAMERDFNFIKMFRKT